MANERTYDVVFIGSGHACWHGALLLKLAGKEVALVERGLAGGTCTNYGCDAKILLDSPIELKEALGRYRGIGLATPPEIDWTQLMAYKKELIGGMPGALGGIFAQFGIDLIQGEARFADAETVEVAGQALRAKKFVVGTGQTYLPLDVPGKEHFRDSRDFLSLDEIPRHVTFVGGGVISMEFASICLALGREVDVVTHGDRVLREYPQAYVSRIVEKMESQGANFVFNAQVESLERAGEGSYVLRCADGTAIESDYVLTAVGRRANVDGMNLEGIGVEFSGRGIKVDSHMRTSVKGIYASGDVIDKDVPKLTPTAEFESNYIAMDILNPLNGAIKYPPVPNLVFTLPRIAQVGVKIDEARESGAYRIEEVPLGETMAWLNKAEADAHMTLAFDGKGRLAGAAVYGDDAGTYIDVLTLIINQKLGGKELGSMIFAFPTPTYGLISTLVPLFLKK